jgi:hypothetical protein
MSVYVAIRIQKKMTKSPYLRRLCSEKSSACSGSTLKNAKVEGAEDILEQGFVNNATLSFFSESGWPLTLNGFAITVLDAPDGSKS